jgi:hypothetical protein
VGEGGWEVIDWLVKAVAEFEKEEVGGEVINVSIKNIA